MTDTPTTNNDTETAGVQKTIELDDGSIAVIFKATEEGMTAAVVYNMDESTPSLLIPLVRGIMESFMREGGADDFIKIGYDAIITNRKVQ